MSLKYFTNTFKGNATDSIAINPNFVISVFPGVHTNEHTNEITEVTVIFAGQNATWIVEDSYLDVVARLNEQ